MLGCHHCGGYLIAEEYSANRENYVRWIADSGLFGERDRILLNNGEACVEASSSHFANGVDTSKAHRAFVKFTAPSLVSFVLFSVSHDLVISKPTKTAIWLGQCLRKSIKPKCA